MTRIISALLLAIASGLSSAAEPLQLVDNPPERHIVVPGDTLWGISGKFLTEPWRWPEIWQMNRAEIKNPHLIYPGDVIVLDTSGGTPRLKRARAVGGTLKLKPQVHSEPVQTAIPSIPPNVIEPYISRPLIVEAGEIESHPRIVATQEERFHVSTGEQFFATGIPDAETVKWSIFKPGKALNDPDTGEVAAYEAFYLGTASLRVPGEPATLVVTSAKQEIGRGNHLIPAPPPTIASYVPHEPESEVQARVMSVYGDTQETGPGGVITLNKGQADGLEVGHVLALYRNRVSQDIDNDRRIDTPVPEERYALAFVFRTFNRVAYALVVKSSRSIVIGDRARNP